MYVRCQNCGREIEGLPYRCKYCGGVFCVYCHLPEKHNCPGLRRGPGSSGKLFEVSYVERRPRLRRETLAPLCIKPPIECEVGGEACLPKQLFPFNEDYLKFALYYELEKRGINAVMEPIIHVYRVKLRRMPEYSESPWKEYLAKLRPDLMLPDMRQIWEIENFWKDPKGIARHAEEYSRELGLECFTFTWLRSGLEAPNLVMVNPITGEVEAPQSLYEPGPLPPENITYGYATCQGIELGAGSLHLWIQYELFRWLRGEGRLVAVEVNATLSGHVFAPDELIISSEQGIQSWMPRDFTPFKGWRVARIGSGVSEVPVRFDVVAADPGDPREVDAYEVKTVEDFRSEEKVLKVLGQLANYVSTGLAARYWLVVPEVPELLKVLNEEFKKWAQKIGLLAYSCRERRFKMFKEPITQPVKTPMMRIQVRE
ncbi:MAG: hypothetical protein DRN04_16630 [Thermoprotei archaeon]|nr:MAG: hypothetical protein DRN04_16630 [Thermoprotei archaeon]